MIRDQLAEHDTVVVDGLRSGAEVERFVDAFGDNFLLVAITAPDEVRAERLDLRARDNTEAETITDRDKRELGFGMGEAIDRAALLIPNDDSLDSFRACARAVIADGVKAAERMASVERNDPRPRTETDGGASRQSAGGMVYSVEVEVVVPVNPTEVTDRVWDAVEGLFPEAEFEQGDGELRGESHSLEHFSELLHEQQILDTARGQFFGGQENNTVAFDLKKQAAFGGVVNFAVGNPGELGEIQVHVRINSPTVEAYVDHVAPPTEDGRPITD
jgi:predicted RNA binding protein with dsRBD fold (UPF0201 family)